MLTDPVDISNYSPDEQKEIINEAYKLVRACDQYSAEHDQHRLIDRHGDWGPSMYCTRSARMLAFYLHGTVRGYYTTGKKHRSAYNPGATIGQTTEGHDFCTAGNGRFIIDYWASDVECIDNHPGIIDRKKHQEQVKNWYGDEENWHVADKGADREHILQYAVEMVDPTNKKIPNSEQ